MGRLLEVPRTLPVPVDTGLRRRRADRDEALPAAREIDAAFDRARRLACLLQSMRMLQRYVAEHDVRAGQEVQLDLLRTGKWAQGL